MVDWAPSTAHRVANEAAFAVILKALGPYDPHALSIIPDPPLLDELGEIRLDYHFDARIREGAKLPAALQACLISPQTRQVLFAGEDLAGVQA